MQATELDLDTTSTDLYTEALYGSSQWSTPATWIADFFTRCDGEDIRYIEDQLSGSRDAEAITALCFDEMTMDGYFNNA